MPRTRKVTTQHDDGFTDDAIIDECLRLALPVVIDAIATMEHVNPHALYIERMRQFASAIADMQERRAQ